MCLGVETALTCLHVTKGNLYKLTQACKYKINNFISIDLWTISRGVDTNGGRFNVVIQAID